MNLQLLNDLLYLEIPKPEVRENGFLEIIRKGHDEVINSRIYAYFLNREINPTLSVIFFEALIDLYFQKTGYWIDIEEFNVQLEVKTKAGNRIDIVIEQSDQSKVLIIENKIYHAPVNPFEDYWAHYPKADKWGVLLTRVPEKEVENFINITHKEWIEAVQLKGLPFKLTAREYVYLNDFFNTIQDISRAITMTEQSRFFFKHAAKIEEAIQTKQTALNFIVNEISKTAEALEMAIYGSATNWRMIWNKNENRNTFYTITYHGLLNGTGENYLIIQMENEDLRSVDELRHRFTETKKEFFDTHKLTFSNWTGTNKIHFIAKKLDLNEKNLERLGDYLYEEIKHSFEPLYLEIIAAVDLAKQTNLS